jgi:hypothetical protein
LCWMLEGLAWFYFSSKRSQWKSRVYLEKGLSVTEGDPWASFLGAQTVAAASFVTLSTQQKVLWGCNMQVSVNHIIPKCFSFWVMSLWLNLRREEQRETFVAGTIKSEEDYGVRLESDYVHLFADLG